MCYTLSKVPVQCQLYSAVTVTPGTSAAPEGGAHAPCTGQGGTHEGV